MFYVFVLVCFSCVVSFQFKEFICIILFLCCFFCHKTKWSSCLHLVVLLPFLFFGCFVLNFVFFFCFFIPLKKRPPKNRTQQKPKKAKMQKKRTAKKENSAIVFTNSVLQFFGVGLKFSFFLLKTL